jgi:hypothetical protein
MDTSKLSTFQETPEFKSIELSKGMEESIEDFYAVRENFNMLFRVLEGVEDEIHRGLILNYYNNFRVEISYPKAIQIEGKFIIGKNNSGEYEFDSNEQYEFFTDDLVEEDKSKVKSYNIVVMVSLETCEPFYFYDNFLQNNEKLENGETLTNAKYWRIPPPHKSCKEFDKLVKRYEEFKKSKIAIGGKRKKRRIMRTKRKRNKRTKRTKRR